MMKIWSVNKLWRFRSNKFLNCLCLQKNNFKSYYGLSCSFPTQCLTPDKMKGVSSGRTSGMKPIRHKHRFVGFGKIIVILSPCRLVLQNSDFVVITVTSKILTSCLCRWSVCFAQS